MKKWDSQMAVKMAVCTGALAATFAAAGAHEMDADNLPEVTEAALVGGLLLGFVLGGLVEESTVEDLITLNFSFFSPGSSNSQLMNVAKIGLNYLLTISMLAGATVLGQNLYDLSTPLKTLLFNQMIGMKTYFSIALSITSIMNAVSKFFIFRQAINNPYQTYGGLAPARTPVVTAQDSITLYDELTQLEQLRILNRLNNNPFFPISSQAEIQKFIASFVPAEATIVNRDVKAVVQANPETIVLKTVKHATVREDLDEIFTQHSTVQINSDINDSDFYDDLHNPVTALPIFAQSDPLWAPTNGRYDGRLEATMFDFPMTEAYTYPYDGRTGRINKAAVVNSMAIVPSGVPTPAQPLSTLLQTLVAMDNALPKPTMSSALVVYKPNTFSLSA